MSTNDIDVVRAFCAAFGRRDVDELMGFFTEDAVYHNIPLAPVQGTAGIRGLLEMFMKPAESVDFAMLHIAAGDGVVFTERVDTFVISGKKVVLPVAGVFELRDGKISAWRDYFDMATWSKQSDVGS